MDVNQSLDWAIAYLHQWKELNLIQHWNIEALEGGAIAQWVPDRDLLLWPQSPYTQVLSLNWTVPEDMSGLPLRGAVVRLRLGWWADWAEVWINGEQVYEGDLFDRECRLPLTYEAVPGETYQFELRVRGPAHDDGALQTSALVFEYPHRACDPGRLGEILQVVKLGLGERAIALIDWESWLRSFKILVGQIEGVAEGRSLSSTNQNTNIWKTLKQLQDDLLPLRDDLKNHRIYLLGNAHIDVAWLWPIAETKDVVKRTFQSVLRLHEHFPRMTFNQSTALSYWWMEQEQPELFSQIQAAVDQGWWELTGGMWVEPDCNLPSGEALVRQILYGKQYFQQQFGQQVRVAWNPDSFGFCAQLPQILLKSGFDVFMTQKLAWNDSNRFPHQVFWWQGIDGSRILTYFTNELGQGIEVEKMAHSVAAWRDRHQLNESLWLYGVGDHGGGPTADMLNIARSWMKEDLFFSLESSTCDAFVDRLHTHALQSDLPIWDDELYLELHRGTYTAKADRKRNNRQLERLLRNVEILRTAAAVSGGLPYPSEALLTAWRSLLVNQFHDILPGSAVPEVFEDADAADAEIREICDRLITDLQAPAPSPDEFCLWNFNDYSAIADGQWILVELSADPWNLDGVTGIYDRQSQTLLPIQPTETGLLFPANLTRISGQVYQFSRSQPSTTPIEFPQTPVICTSDRLENQWIVATFDPATGELQHLFDKRTNLTLLSHPARLQCFADGGQYWDAWNLDPDYESKELDAPQLVSIEAIATGPLRATLRIIRTFRQSRIQQDVHLDCVSPTLTVHTTIDWQETHILLKAAFPLAFSSPIATYEIPFGVIERSTTRSTDFERAKWEVPALRWADMSAGDRGLTILNDCKYGYDAIPDRMRLTLLTSPTWPDPNSDRGHHEFTYQLLPHGGDWRSANVLQHASVVNDPPVVLPPMIVNEASIVPAISAPNIILSACKPSEDGTGWILRLYESAGKSTSTQLTFVKPIQGAEFCDLLEHSNKSLLDSQDNRLHLSFNPFEVITVKISCHHQILREKPRPFMAGRDSGRPPGSNSFNG